MKILKKIALLLCLLLLALVGAGLILPSATVVSRAVVIERDSSAVFARINNLKEFNKWSPWAAKDRKTQYTYTGAQQGVGSKMSWRSDNPQVGVGSQEIVESIENKEVKVRLYFEGQGEASAYYLLEPKTGATKITWGFSIDHGFNIVSRYMGLMLDTWVGADYEAGLQALKKLVEGEQQ